MNIFGWISRIANMKSVIESVLELIRNLSVEIQKLENEGGGALQPQLHAMRTNLMANAEQLAAAVAVGTSADQEAQDAAANAETAEQVLERQKAGAMAPADANFGQSSSGAAQAAADSLKDQDSKSPDKSSKKK
jgi:hypothetical protein